MLIIMVHLFIINPEVIIDVWLIIKRKDRGPSTKNQLQKLASAHDYVVKVL